MLANWIRKKAVDASPQTVRRAANLFPPFLASGIHIVSIENNYHHIRVELKRRWYNQNYVGTQFGGAMYMMTDPFFMIMLIQILGPDYIVWDKSAKIDFIKPGKSELTVDFLLTADDIEDIKRKTASGEKLFVDKRVEIKDRDGVLIATVDKTIYVRRKPQT